MIRRDVSTLWIGGPLGHLERLSLISFLNHGFTVNLYTYDCEIDAPPGVVLRSGDEILAQEMVFENSFQPGTFSAFSNLFRYRMLQLRDTTWIDTDVVALGRELPATHYLYAWESPKFLNGAVLGAPQESSLLSRLYEQSIAVEASSVQWGQLGPRLITKTVRELDLVGEATRRTVIYPLNFRQIWKIFDPGHTKSLWRKTRGSATLHLWNEVMRNQPVKSLAPPEGSFLSELMNLHSVEGPAETVDIEWIRRSWRPQISPHFYEPGFLEQRAGRIIRFLHSTDRKAPSTP